MAAVVHRHRCCIRPMDYPQPTAHKDAAFEALEERCQKEQMMDDLPCPCCTDLLIEERELMLYKVNKRLEARGVGLLCYKIEGVDKGKKNQKSCATYTLRCIRAYPARYHVLDISNCVSMKLLRARLAGAFACAYDERCGEYREDFGYVLLPNNNNLGPPQTIKVPSPEGWVFMSQRPEKDSIRIDLCRSHCPICQGV